MVSKADILGLAPDRDHWRIITDDQSTGDIEKGIIASHKKFKTDYDHISELFLGDTVEDTAEKIWKFLRKNVPYKRESKELQTVRSPYSIVAFPADCKSYALFAGGIIDSLNRKGFLNVPFAYRFASYDENNWKEPGHVFLVLYPGTTNEIWIDPVPEISYFDEKLEPVAYKDKIFKPMSLVEISGISTPANPVISSVQCLRSYRDQLNLERLNLLTSGQMRMNSEDDLEYIQAIEELDKQINNGGIGAIDPKILVNLGKGILSIFQKGDNNSPESIAMKSDGWNKTDRELGHQFGWAAADVIKNGRPDIEPEQTLRWLMLNGVQGVLNNTEWGTVTKSDIVRYFENRGRPLSDAMKQSLGLSTNVFSSLVEPTSAGGSGGLMKMLPIILIGGGLLYVVTKKKRR